MDAEELIRETQRFLEEGQAIAHVGSWVSGILAGDRIWWSEETYRIFGIDEREDITVERFFSLVHPEDRDRVRRASHAAQHENAAYDIVHRVIRPDGRVRTVRERAVVMRDARGEPARMVGAVQDITDQIRLAERDRLLAHVSARLTQVLDYPKILDAVAQLAVPSLADRAVVEVHDDSGAHRTSAGEVATEGLAALRMPIRARGYELGTITLWRRVGDFDELDQHIASDFAFRAAFAIENARLYREARKSIEARDEFLAIVAHELKTPVAPLRIQLESLLRQIDQGRELSRDKLRDKLRSIDRSATRLERVIATLLEVSELTFSGLTLHRVPTDLADVARHAIERLRAQIEHSGSAVAMRVEFAVATFDPERVEEACEQLLSNAVKYGGGKPIDISVQSDADVVRFSVLDRGIGIAPDQQRALFERFQRRAPLRYFGGFGLGLWIVRRIVEAHGGTVEVSSRPGEGARFAFSLPRASSEAH